MLLEIQITDEDRRVDYSLQVSVDALDAEPEVGLGQAIEVNTVRCTEVTTWLGDYAVSAFPGHDARESLEKKLGQWCLDRYADEITEAIQSQLEPAYA